ncbi:hypothetical protein C3489_31720 [Streptomyces sp. Ru71]|nr:hypothetical protein C3489_31720 [Streptomyces sp. Ru71]
MTVTRVPEPVGCAAELPGLLDWPPPPLEQAARTRAAVKAAAPVPSALRVVCAEIAIWLIPFDIDPYVTYVRNR